MVPSEPQPVLGTHPSDPQGLPVGLQAGTAALRKYTLQGERQIREQGVKPSPTAGTPRKGALPWEAQLLGCGGGRRGSAFKQSSLPLRAANADRTTVSSAQARSPPPPRLGPGQTPQECSRSHALRRRWTCLSPRAPRRPSAILP